MPPRQAWDYIQTNGLLAYWNVEARPSPPFRSGYARPTSLYASRPSTLPYRQPVPAYSRAWAWSEPPSYRVEPPRQRYYSAVPDSAPRTRSTPPLSRSRPSPATPRVRLPTEEPPPTPRFSPATPRVDPIPSIPAPSLSTNEPPAMPPPRPANDLPYGTPVAGRPNMVNSPYAGKTQLVDVSGMGPGQTVKCPYSGKLFRVPVAQQATNTIEPGFESKSEPSKPSEPSPETKKQ